MPTEILCSYWMIEDHGPTKLIATIEGKGKHLRLPVAVSCCGDQPVEVDLVPGDAVWRKIRITVKDITGRD